MLLYQRVEYLCKQYDELDLNKFSTKSQINSLISQVDKEWITIMSQIGLVNKVKETFSLNNIKITRYGFDIDIFIVPPFCCEDLSKNIESIQENLGCLIVFKHEKVSKWINCKFIFYNDDTKTYKSIKQTKSYMLYIGNDYAGNPIFLNLKDYPHALITGGTRSGKSKMTDCILTNLIINCSPNILQLYLCQIAKSDLILYEDIEHTKAFADNLNKTEQILGYIINTVIPYRNDLIKPYRKKALADNYHDYNKLNHTDKIPTLMIVFDEMSSLYQIKGDDNNIKKQKQLISGLIDKIAQYGSGLGIFLICSLQRPTADNISPFVKAQATSLVSFRQNNSKSAEVATDDTKLPIGLRQREFVYHTDNWDFGIVPWIDNKEIYNLIKPYIKPNHRTIFDDFKKVNSIKSKQITDKKVIKSQEIIKKEPKIDKKELELAKNIAKIPNYVPYEDYSDKKVINEDNKNIKTEKKNGWWLLK